MRISDWSSDVCSSDLAAAQVDRAVAVAVAVGLVDEAAGAERRVRRGRGAAACIDAVGALVRHVGAEPAALAAAADAGRSEEHTSELQSLMRISYAVFCLKKKTQVTHTITRQKYESNNH